MKRLGKYFFWVLALPIGFSSYGFCAVLETRARLTVAPEKILPQALKAAELQDWEKMERCLAILSPLAMQLDEMYKKNLNQQLKTALANKNKEKALHGFLGLTATSIQALLAEAREKASPKEIRQHIRLGLTEFLVLDPYIRSVNFGASKKIKMSFRLLHNLAVSNPAKFKTTSSEMIELLNQAYSDYLKAGVR